MTTRLFAGIVTRMAARSRTIIRSFDGSLANAEGLLAVEQSAFDDCPYDAGQLQAMLTEGTQRAWLAIAGCGVVGFVIAFPSHGLQGLCWEDTTSGLQAKAMSGLQHRPLCGGFAPPSLFIHVTKASRWDSCKHPHFGVISADTDHDISALIEDLINHNGPGEFCQYDLLKTRRQEFSYVFFEEDQISFGASFWQDVRYLSIKTET